MTPLEEIQAYLPHRPPMLLLEEVVAVTEQDAHCRVRVSPAGVLAPFLDAKGALPSWYGLELIAQTVGVWSGCGRCRRDENGAELGMILGARDLSCTEDGFAPGSLLDIHVDLIMQDGRFAGFEGRILCGEKRIVSGRVTTFQPQNDELAGLFTRG